MVHLGTPERVLEDERVAAFALATLDEKSVAARKPDLIVEVAHPCITTEHGPMFLGLADYMVGSPTVFAAAEVEAACRAAATRHGLYIPAGALWGAVDIQKMAARGTLAKLTVTMAKHPSSFKLGEPLSSINAAIDPGLKEDTVLYDGPVRALCPLAPNNVNTMAAAALAANTLGFDGVCGRLISNPTLDAHIVTIEAEGPTKQDGGAPFSVKTVRHNPAAVGAVTGSATYVSFVSSMLRAKGQGPGLHFC